jgi:hypothetical protein
MMTVSQIICVFVWYFGLTIAQSFTAGCWVYRDDLVLDIFYDFGPDWSTSTLVRTGVNRATGVPLPSETLDVSISYASGVLTVRFLSPVAVLTFTTVTPTRLAGSVVFVRPSGPSVYCMLKTSAFPPPTLSLVSMFAPMPTTISSPTLPTLTSIQPVDNSTKHKTITTEKINRTALQESSPAITTPTAQSPGDNVALIGGIVGGCFGGVTCQR